MGCNCKKTTVEAPNPILDNLKDKFIIEPIELPYMDISEPVIDEFDKIPQTKEQFHDDELRKWNGGNYPLIED
jgi:hypothetical protein